MKYKNSRELKTKITTKKYKCKHCSKLFNNKTNKTNHQKSHKNTKTIIVRSQCTCGIYINSNDKHQHLKTKYHQ